MIQLYLNNQKADLHTDINIPLTYETVNFSKPEATINSFSKTVQLYGSTNNNKIFNNLYRFDSFNNGDNQFNVGRKNSFIILINDGEYFDSGYFSLDKISKDNDDNIIYNITLYGGIGDFFYNLMYGTNTKSDKFNLGNLYYGIDDKSYTNEETDNLFEYNKDFVFAAWQLRCDDTKFDQTPDNKITKMFCPIPTYGGYYDDFKSDTVLYYTLGTVKHNFQDTQTVDDKTYTNNSGWCKVTADREMSEWETIDLRSHKQRLGIRIKNIYEAIKDPFNNGGYTIDDSNVNDIEKQYINNSYLMLDRFDFENIQNLTSKSESVLTVDNYKLDGNTVAVSVLPENTYQNPQVNVDILPGFKNTEACTNITTILNNNKGGNSTSTVASFQYFVAWLTSEDGTDYISSDIILYGGSSNDYANDIDLSNIDFTLIENYVYSQLPFIQRVTVNPVVNPKLFKRYCKSGYNLQQGTSNTFYGRENINIQLPVSRNNLTKLKIISGTINYIAARNDKGVLQFNTIYASTKLLSVNTDYIDTINVFYKGAYNGIFYTGNITPPTYLGDQFGIIQNNTLRLFDSTGAYGATSHNLYKTAIFNDTMSPYEFLISLGRMFNWKFVKDKFENKVYIYSNNRYFIDEVVNIQDNIDFTQYDITPTTVQYNQYKFGIESPESYYFNLYKKKYNDEYGQYNYNTGYQLNTESKSILEDCKFQLAVPYLMQSVYYNDEVNNWSKPEFMNYTVTLWDEDSNSEDFKTIGYHNVTDYSMNFGKTDLFPKLCCFTGNYESSSDFKSVFVLYDKQLTKNVFNTASSKNYQISDDIPITNELADGNCYYYAYGQSTITTTSSTARKVTTKMTHNIPIFTNKFLHNNELYMSTYQVPLTDYSLQGISNTIHDIFQTMFSYYYNDMFTLSNKVLSVKCWLKEEPSTAMRKFYSFNNNLWILNKVTDYIPERNNLVKCDFIMIQDKNNYLA